MTNEHSHTTNDASSLPTYHHHSQKCCHHLPPLLLPLPQTNNKKMGPNNIVIIWAPGNFSFMFLLFYFQLISFFSLHIGFV